MKGKSAMAGGLPQLSVLPNLALGHLADVTKECLMRACAAFSMVADHTSTHSSLLHRFDVY